MPNSTEVLSACDEILNAPLNRLPEALFRTRYLPLFTGEPTEATFEEWIRVTGSAFREVEVYDNSGTLVFTVPPLLYDSDSYLEQLNKVGVMQQMQLAEQKAASMPMLGELHIQRYLTDQVKSVDPDWKSVKMWNTIFARYGKPTIPIPGDKAADPGDVSVVKAPPKRDEFDDIFGAELR